MTWNRVYFLRELFMRGEFLSAFIHLDADKSFKQPEP